MIGVMNHVKCCHSYHRDHITFSSHHCINTEMALLTDLAVWGMEQGGLTSTIPTEVGTMTNLVFMDFDFNALSGSLPSELFLLTNLNQLDLNNNQLTGNVEGLGALVNLEFLQLHSK